VAGTCQCGNELPVFIKCGEFLDTAETLLHAINNVVMKSTFLTARHPRSQLTANKELVRIGNQGGVL